MFANSQRARLVLESPNLFSYHAFTLHNPERLVIDLKNTNFSRYIKQSKNKSIIKDIRLGKYNLHTKRLVLDINSSKFSYKTFTIPKSEHMQHRLVIDIKNLAKKTLNPKIYLSASKSSIKHKDRNIVVVIDPGHGGKDPGAIGYRGTKEKNVVLAIAKDLQRDLNAQKGFHAELTRSGDYFIPLRGRLRILRHDHGDMFIAIHADAYLNHTAHGASVFALSQHGATTEAARWLARKENESELGHVLTDKSHVLKSVLIDLAQTASITSSLAVGDDIIHKLARVTDLHHGFVEQAAFVVLKEPEVPSLLVETGFLSNPKEELKLRNSHYQHRIAYALMQGIIGYYKKT